MHQTLTSPPHADLTNFGEIMPINCLLPFLSTQRSSSDYMLNFPFISLIYTYVYSVYVFHLHSAIYLPLEWNSYMYIFMGNTIQALL